VRERDGEIEEEEEEEDGEVCVCVCARERERGRESRRREREGERKRKRERERERKKERERERERVCVWKRENVTRTELLALYRRRSADARRHSDRDDRRLARRCGWNDRSEIGGDQRLAADSDSFRADVVLYTVV